MSAPPQDAADPEKGTLQTDAALEKNTSGFSSPSVESAPAVVAPAPQKQGIGMSLTREILFVATACSAQLLALAGLAQAIAPVRIIGDSFGTSDAGQLSWFTAAYSLTVGTFILVSGRLGDIFGHKTMFILGYAWFSLWSLVAGVSVYARSQIFFDFCRAMQGIGPAILLPNSLALLGRYPPGHRKAMVFSIFGASGPNGFVVGALFSSLLGQFAWWPWAYWCLSILCLMMAFVAKLVIPSFETAGSGRHFDYLGAIFGVAGLVLFNVAWNQAPVAGWQAPYVIVLLILGIASVGAFFFAERRARQPLLPLKGLSKEVGFVIGCVALGWSSFGIWLFYMWQFLESLRGNTPLSVVAQLSPVTISGTCAALFTGHFLQRVRTAYVMCAAMVAFCVGNILLATAPVDQAYWIQVFLATVVTPWGMNLSFPAATLILSNFLPKEHQGIAAALVATAVNYSISIGLGIAGTVEVHVNDGGVNLLAGYRGAWYAAIGLAFCGILLSGHFILVSHRQR